MTLRKRFSYDNYVRIKQSLIEKQKGLCLGCNDSVIFEGSDLSHKNEEPSDNRPENLCVMHHACNQRARNEAIRKANVAPKTIAPSMSCVSDTPYAVAPLDSSQIDPSPIELNKEYEPVFRFFVINKVWSWHKNGKAVKRSLLELEGAALCGCSPRTARRYMDILLTPLWGVFKETFIRGNKVVVLANEEDYDLYPQEIFDLHPRRGTDRDTESYRNRLNQIMRNKEERGSSVIDLQ